MSFTGRHDLCKMASTNLPKRIVLPSAKRFENETNKRLTELTLTVETQRQQLDGLEKITLELKTVISGKNDEIANQFATLQTQQKQIDEMVKQLAGLEMEFRLKNVEIAGQADKLKTQGTQIGYLSVNLTNLKGEIQSKNVQMVEQRRQVNDEQVTKKDNGKSKDNFVSLLPRY